MTQAIFKLTLSFFLVSLLFISCRKVDDLVQPIPETPPPAQSRYFQVVIDSLPGSPVGQTDSIFALVNIVNERNEHVFENRKLQISFDGKFRTPKLELPAGNYRITQLLIVNTDNKIRFATPFINSVRSALVKKPLPVSFTLLQPAALSVPIEVAKVLITDRPESFGYPAGLFNEISDNPNNENPFFRIKMKLAIRVGVITYDSIPGTALYSEWNAQEQVSGKYITLAAGTNELMLSRAAKKHHFRISKWGASYEITILKDQIREDSMYILGGAKQAKKLKMELTYKLVDGKYLPQTKTSFSYHNDGSISGIDYYMRKPDNSPYLAMRDVFQYNNGRLQEISRYDENNQQNGATSFDYNGVGKINRINESANNIQTTATVDYQQSAITGVTEVIFGYSYSNSSPGMKYYQRYEDGNLISENSITDNGNTETGRYEYDNNINPYAHMGWYNLFLSNHSKNNRLSQWKTYYGSYPAAVGYQFTYKYDAEGYPVELIAHYKSYMTNQFLYTTKTVYSY